MKSCLNKAIQFCEKKKITMNGTNIDEIDVQEFLRTKSQPDNRLNLCGMEIDEALIKLKIRLVELQESCTQKLFIMTCHTKEDLKSAVISFAHNRRIENYVSEYNSECVVMVIKPEKSFLRKLVEIVFIENFLQLGIFIMVLRYHAEKLAG